jgi:hypothetical protein
VAVKYVRIKFWWGTVEAFSSDEGMYTAAQTKKAGDAATPPGIGVRRCQLIFNREPAGSTEDVATTHMDFMNVTGGEPDDTWVDADFTTLETAISTWWTAVKTHCHTTTKLAQYRWYRIGPGVFPPNPPVKITTFTPVPGTGTDAMPPQVAASITLKPPARKQWGRIYIPGLSIASATSGTGRIVSTAQNNFANATDTLHGTAAAADFIPVVYSKTRSKAFAIESLQVDDLFDVIRSRRWDRPLVRVTKS